MIGRMVSVDKRSYTLCMEGTKPRDIGDRTYHRQFMKTSVIGYPELFPEPDDVFVLHAATYAKRMPEGKVVRLHNLQAVMEKSR